MDGRALPFKDEVEPWWNGYSVGRWEGDTLVVETAGFMDDGWLDVRGSPLTSSGKMIERFRRPNFGSLSIEVTIDDPKAYTKPFTATVTNRLLPDTQLIEFVCLDKSESHYVGADGKVGARERSSAAGATSVVPRPGRRSGCSALRSMRASHASCRISKYDSRYATQNVTRGRGHIDHAKP